jgi:hypothetical protein
MMRSVTALPITGIPTVSSSAFAIAATFHPAAFVLNVATPRVRSPPLFFANFFWLWLFFFFYLLFFRSGIWLVGF